MPSNTVLISGPAVGAAQILIWSCSSVFLPPVSTANRTSAFSFVRALSDLSYLPWTQSLTSWLCGFNLQLAQLVGRFWVFSLSHPVPWCQLWFYFHLCMWLVHWRLPWGCPGGLGLPLWGPGVEVGQLLGFRGLRQHHILKGVSGLGSRK